MLIIASFIGPNSQAITDLKKSINKRYTIEDRGPASLFLGVQIIRDRRKGLLWLSQKQYIEKAIEFFNLQGSKPIRIPL